MVHKDLFAFTTTFSLFLLLTLILNIIPTDALISHNNHAKQKISMDFITVKQLLCQVQPKQVQKKSPLKRPTKELKKSLIKPLKKQETIAKVQKSQEIVEKVLKVEKKPIVVDLAEIEKAKQLAAEKERLKQIAAAQMAKVSNTFFTHITKKINENKNYPRIAKRRSIEGYTRINFTIFKNGSIKINKLEGNKIFYEKSKEALTESFPVEIPQKILSTFPKDLDVNLQYALL